MHVSGQGNRRIEEGELLRSKNAMVTPNVLLIGGTGTRYAGEEGWPYRFHL